MDILGNKPQIPIIFWNLNHFSAKSGRHPGAGRSCPGCLQVRDGDAAETVRLGKPDLLGKAEAGAKKVQEKIRNPNIEIRNKSEYRNHK
jgi:hypothetical protein